MKGKTIAAHAEKYRHLLSIDRSHRPAAYDFLIEALECATLEAAVREPERIHVMGRDLQDAIRRRAMARFGVLAPAVLDAWGLRGPRDFWEMLFNLASIGFLILGDPKGSQDLGGPDDLADIFEFHPVMGSDGTCREWRISFAGDACWCDPD